MDKIITNDEQLKKHRVNKYVFRSLEDDGSGSSDIYQVSNVDSLGLPIANGNDGLNIENGQNNQQYNEQPSQKMGLDLNEVKDIKNNQSNMLKIVEEMSKLVQVLKGDFDIHNKNINEHFEKNIQQTYENAVKTGESEALRQHEAEINQIKQRLVEAVDTLTSTTESCKELMNNLESELVKSSIEIAKEVIQISVEEHHEKIATSLANLLIADLKDATDIILKVNPIDLAYLKQHITNDKIKLEPDIAIASGGVVVLSSLGNIDGTIKERLAKVKSTFYESINSDE
jgi:flagellar assembly protein FliH